MGYDTCAGRSSDNKVYELAIEHLNVKANECVFVRDGGFNELKGARSVGMKTLFTEALDVKYDKKRAQVMEYTDYNIKEFKEISYLLKRINGFE